MHAISNFALQYANVDYHTVWLSPYDLFITEGAPLPRPGSTPALTDAEVAVLVADGGARGDRVIAGYVNVAVTDDNRGYWDPAWTSDGTDTGTPVNGVAPAWLTGQPTHDFDGGGPDAYIVEFWDPDWTQIVIDQAVDLVNRGYNGVFLDDVGIYWALGQVGGQPDVQTLAQHMIDLVQAVSAAIKAINPDAMVITNGNPFIGGDAGGGGWSTAFTDAIDAMVMENPSSIDLDGAVANILPTDPVLVISSNGTGPTPADYYADGVIPYVSPTPNYDDLGEYIGPQTNGNDVIVGGDGPNVISGAGGDDVIRGGGGFDMLSGDGGIDIVDYSDMTGAVEINLYDEGTPSWQEVTVDGENSDAIRYFEGAIGGSGDDIINGRSGSVIVDGGGGDDVITMWNSGIDVLSGGAGDDTINGGSGADTLSGGDGLDTVSYFLGTAVTVNLTTGYVSDGDTISGFENVEGSSYDDVITGAADANVLAGGYGADTINGLGGDDVIIGGPAGDTLNGGDGIDTLSYNLPTAGWVIVNLSTNTVGGYAYADVISGFENVIGAPGDDTITGSAGANRLEGLAGNDTLNGLGGDDVLLGGLGNDTLNGGDGADSLDGGDGNDSLQGLAGDDLLTGGLGADTLNGGDGVDTLNYAGSHLAVYVRLFNNTAFGGEANGDVISGFENVTGSRFNDDLIGNSGDNVLIGGAGDDKLQGLGGDDTLIGGAGGDTLDGGDGIDTVSYVGSSLAVYVRLFNNTAFGGDANGDVISNVENATGSSNNDDLMGSYGNNLLSGGAGADLLRGLAGDDVLVGGQGADTLDGGDATDTVSYVGSALGVYVRLFNNTVFGGDANGDVISNVENATGSSNNDDLMGSNGANVLTGGAGNDLIQGLGGNDTLIGGVGADTLNGGDGIDTISYLGSALGVYVRLFNNTVFGGDANGDVISNVESATGSSNNDDLMGSNGANVLDGGAGADTIQGLGGDDTLVGGLGADTLNGGDGVDTIGYAGSAAAVTVNLLAGTGSGGDAAGDVIQQVENVTGSAFSDVLTGGAGANVLTGGGGGDTLNGDDGLDTASYAGSGQGVTVRLYNNTAFGGDADGDVLSNIENLAGSAFNDELVGTDGANLLVGGAGDDLLRGMGGDDVLTGGQGADALQGSTGNDTISYAGSALGVYVRLYSDTVFGGDANGDTISDIENATGSSGNDDLRGSANVNRLDGGAGDDLLIGFVGGDTLIGGDGVDTVSYAGSLQGVTVNLATNAVSGGDAAGDVISGFENVTGSSLNDDLRGSAGANRLEGGVGNDSLTGGAGNDRFVFSGASGSDTISDFAAGAGAGDVIQLTGSVFTDYADVLAHTNDDGLGNTVISKSGVQITLTGVLESQLAADDFVFSASSPAATPAVWQMLPTLDARSGADLWSAAAIDEALASPEVGLALAGLGLERPHPVSAPSDYDWVW